MYLGDRLVGSTIYHKFTSRRFSTGAPFALASGDIEVYKDDSTTQKAEALTADFDSITGLVHFTIDTSADGTFYSAGGQFYVTLSAGTVDSVSVVGEVVAGFRLVAAEGDVSDILSRLVVTNSQLLVVKSDTSDIRSHLVVIHSETTAIQSDTTTLASDLAEGDFSDILSRLTVMQAVISDIQSDTNVMVPIVSDIQSDTNVIVSQLLIVKSDTSDIKSHLTAINAIVSDIQSDTNVMVPIVSDIQSDTNKLVSDLSEADTSDIQSLLTKVYSDTTAIEAGGGSLTAAQDSLLTKINSDQVSQFAVVEPFVSDIASDTAHIESDAVRIESMVTVIKSDTSDIISALVKVYSDTTLATAAAGEPGQGTPPVSATTQDKVAYLYKAWRNRTTQTSTEYALYADDATTKDHEAAVSDDGTTFVRGEVATGA